jgi:hypothetical protein
MQEGDTLDFHDGCHLEGAHRLSQDAAIQGGTRLERNSTLAQNDALHVRTCAHRDSASNLPEDVTRNNSAVQGHSEVRRLNESLRNLNDEDGTSISCEVEVPGDLDASAEGVDTSCQWSRGATEGFDGFTAEDTRSVFDLRAVGGSAPRGIVVCGLHVADRGGQSRLSHSAVARRVGFVGVPELRGRRKPICLICRVQDQGKAGHGGRYSGRHADVAADSGLHHVGDAGLGEDREGAGRPERNRSRISIELALSTADGLGSCRKRKGKDGDEEAASGGREHHGWFCLEIFRKYVR